MENTVKSYSRTGYITRIQIDLYDGSEEIMSKTAMKFWVIEINGKELDRKIFNECYESEILSLKQALNLNRLGYVKDDNYWWLITVSDQMEFVKHKLNISLNDSDYLKGKKVTSDNGMLIAELTSKQVFI